MIDGFFYVLTLLTALGCGLTAGVFFGFSSFVMKALARLGSPAGIAAMQSINREAPTPLFMAALLGTALGCVAVAVSSLFIWDEPAAVYMLVGGLVYLVGTMLLTIAYHIPRNEALAGVDPDGAEAADHWQRYVSGWTGWNHVRTGAALAAAAILTVALRVS